MEKISKIILLATFVLLGFLTVAGPALAQEEPDYDRINEIAKDLNCPTCAGINLADCRTLTCEQWRAKIAELVEEDYTDQEVLDYFASRYGTQVLQEPPRSGFTLLLWVLPVLALLAGGAWLIYTMRGWQQEPATQEVVDEPAAPSAPGTDQPDDDYLNQVEKDLGLS